MTEALQRTCGTCQFGRRMPNMKINQRLCFGGPPQILVLPAPPQAVKLPDGRMQQITPGTFQLQNARPIVDAHEPECGFYKPKSISEIMQNNINAAPQEAKQ